MKINPFIKIIIKLFLCTRLFYISLIVIVYSFKIVKKYDLSSDLLGLGQGNQNFLEKIISKFLSFFSSYDAIHFIIIAKNNYIIFSFISLVSKGFSSIFIFNFTF